MSKLGELAVYYQKKGLRETMARIRDRYCRILPFVLFQRDLTDSYQGAMPEDGQRIIADDFALLEQERSRCDDLPREFYIDKTHRGRHFYLLYVDGELAGICWMFARGDYSRFFRMRDASSCELNYFLTMPQFRGRQLCARLTNYACADLRDKGFKKAVLAISEGNPASIKALTCANFEEWQRVRSICSFVGKRSV